MPLKTIHDTVDEIPEPYRDLYTEKDGKFVLTGISGVKTQADVDRVSSALEKERSDHRETKSSLRQWADLGLELPDVTSKLDRFRELEVAASGKQDEMDAKLEELTEARVRSRLGPVERENSSLKKQLDDTQGELEALRSEKVQRAIHDRVRSAANESKVLSEAHQDVLLLADAVFELTEGGEVVTKENPYNVPSGLNPELFFQEMQSVRSYWWPANSGTNAPGSKSGGRFSNNPWAKDTWSLTEQGKVVREHGMERAEAMAKAAGSRVGAVRPV